jgi:4-amino-4-deoxy-L-arabinose transferase-like glycosyltransferase
MNVLAAAGRRARRLPRPDPTRACDLAAAGLCLLALVLAAWVSTSVFDRVPHVEDEVAFLFQARTIASGHVIAGAPSQPEFFSIPFVIVRDGHWFGKYPPGFPAVLALGAWAGAPWLVNPLAGALSVGLVYLAGRRLYGPGTGLLAAALLVSSPFFLLQAGSLMSHATSLVWALLALLAFESARRRRSGWAALGCGVALGALLLSRSLTAVGIGLPVALWMLVDSARDRSRLRVYLPAVAGFVPFVVALLLYNQATTGDPLRSAYELWWPYDRIGFGDGRARDGTFTFPEALDNTQANTRSLADFLFGWPSRMSLVPAAIASVFVLGRLADAGWRRLRGCRRSIDPTDGWDLFLLATALSLAAAHLLYWSDGQMYGPRYYFEAIGALALLSARGLLQAATSVTRAVRLAPLRAPAARVLPVAAVLLVTAGLTIHSARIFTPRQFDTFRDWYGINRDGVRRVEAAGVDDAVVFVQRRKWTDYAPFFAENDPDLDSDVVYAVDLGATKNQRLLNDFPEREAWSYRDGAIVPADMRTLQRHLER